MSSVTYSTENAQYTQLYAVHTLPVNDPVLVPSNANSVDAIVLEAYHSEAWFNLLWKSEFKQYHDRLFTMAQRTGTPIYIVDVLTTAAGRGFESLAGIGLDSAGLLLAYDGAKKVRDQMKGGTMSRRQFSKFFTLQSAKVALGTFLGLHLFHEWYTTSTGHNPELLARANAVRMHLIPTPQLELRNSIAAKKIEEYVAPELRERLGRKPNIVLVYGAGHSGLKEDLQHQGLRNFYVVLYRALGFPGIDTTYLDTVTNLSIGQNGNYVLKHRKTNLFS